MLSYFFVIQLSKEQLRGIYMNTTFNTDSASAEKEMLARNALFDALIFRNTFTQVVMQFVQLHLDTIPVDYWTAHFGNPKPSTEQIIEHLVLNERSVLNNDDLTDEQIAFHQNHLDFVLPANISVYSICVSFEDGEPYNISINN